MQDFHRPVMDEKYILFNMRWTKSGQGSADRPGLTELLSSCSSHEASTISPAFGRSV